MCKNLADVQQKYLMDLSHEKGLSNCGHDICSEALLLHHSKSTGRTAPDRCGRLVSIIQLLSTEVQTQDRTALVDYIYFWVRN